MTRMYPDYCPVCGGPLLLIWTDWACSVCGTLVPRWPRVGGTGPEDSSDFFVDGPKDQATSPNSASGPSKPSVSGQVQVLEDPDQDGFRSYGCTRLGLLAPPSFTLMNSTRLQQLMKGNCDVNEAPTPRSLPHEGPTGADGPHSLTDGCFPEAQEKLCKFYDARTHICREDGIAWCLNPATPICWTRIDQERAKKSWPVYKGSQWKNNAECPVCGAKVNYEIASCETGCNYCCDAHATQHVKEETPEGGW